MNALEILKDRGFVENTTHDEELAEHLEQGPATCYIGFDPTAESFHVGSLVPVMSLVHMQKNGHKPIALMGGGTGLVGDPSGKTEMRKLMTRELVNRNAESLRKQLAGFMDFSLENVIMENNADWLEEINYIDFLRDIGRHFSVNRMIKAQGYKTRIESEAGLSFIEFNYMLLQAYDFMKLFEKHQCRVQMGGSDQWGNIVAGIDLIRRMHGETAFGITFPLLTTAGGAKMGKTEKGAVWLDADLTPPYDYYQFWVNTEDRDVERFLALFTLLPMQEIRAVEKLKDAEMNRAKSVLAYEATLLAHGREDAEKAFHAAAAMFGSKDVPKTLLPSSSIPRQSSGASDSTPGSFANPGDFHEPVPVFKIFQEVGLAKSGGAAKRLIKQGGAYINGRRIETVDHTVTSEDFVNGEILLRAGKKRYHRMILEAG